jgi:hypothetical protein
MRRRTLGDRGNGGPLHHGLFRYREIEKAIQKGGQTIHHRTAVGGLEGLKQGVTLKLSGTATDSSEQRKEGGSTGEIANRCQKGLIIRQQIRQEGLDHRLLGIGESAQVAGQTAPKVSVNVNGIRG